MKQMQNSAPQAVSNLPVSMSLAASSRLGTMLATAALLLALALPGMARDKILGLGDDILDVEANGTLFTNNTSGQGFYMDATVEADWWVGKDFNVVQKGNEGGDIMTHINEVQSAGDSFWMGITFEYPQSPLAGKGGIKMGFFSETIRSNSRDLEGAEIWLGMNYWNDAEEGNLAAPLNVPISGTPPDYTQGFSVVEEEALVNHGIQTSVPTGPGGFDASEIPGGIDLWNKFTVGPSTGKDWGFKINEELDSYLLSWVVGVLLPDPFADSSASTNVITDGLADNVTNDIFFRYTVDENGVPLNDPVEHGQGLSPVYDTTGFDPDLYKNPDFGTSPFEPDPVVVIPEPSSSVLVMLGALALIMRRKRS